MTAQNEIRVRQIHPGNGLAANTPAINNDNDKVIWVPRSVPVAVYEDTEDESDVDPLTPDGTLIIFKAAP